MVPYNDSSGNTSTTSSASFQSIMNCKQVYMSGHVQDVLAGITKQNKTKQSNQIKQMRGSRIVRTSQRGLGVSVGRAGPRCAGGSERRSMPDMRKDAPPPPISPFDRRSTSAHAHPHTSPLPSILGQIRSWQRRYVHGCKDFFN